MEIRDAVEADAGRLADLADSPPDVMRNLVHDRTVRVATEADEVVGFVSYDAKQGTVHVTQLAGSQAVCERLLAEPITFAEREHMAVELLVTADESEVETAVEATGFTQSGPGPEFAGESTVRYRLEPAEKASGER
ncbi:hypothetical protein NDI56_12315 [Haloarcula sp. S1CR25-12]|uniref:N-acetyltransferase domain-containing protein n=1 Tax=Haloarcula saliterrae TaxID=2950534 RepID=A0ABU2FD44_9EURY|nr:hypothetical protein [Haloarcula sp. S1CR25-12]MDS0260179.1 hypothetical protein [Haloarcula sp. S1CR25-12]